MLKRKTRVEFSAFIIIKILQEKRRQNMINDIDLINKWNNETKEKGEKGLHYETTRYLNTLRKDLVKARMIEL